MDGSRFVLCAVPAEIDRGDAADWLVSPEQILPLHEEKADATPPGVLCPCIYPFLRSRWQHDDNHNRRSLAMTPPDCATLITDGEFPAPFLAASLQNGAPVFVRHPVQKPVLATAWNAFWLPCSLRHNVS